MSESKVIIFIAFTLHMINDIARPEAAPPLNR